VLICQGLVSPGEVKTGALPGTKLPKLQIFSHFSPAGGKICITFMEVNRNARLKGQEKRHNAFVQGAFFDIIARFSISGAGSTAGWRAFSTFMKPRG